MADAPLLNEYKQEFVWRRIPQTLLGGPNLKLGYEAPWYVFALQILVWFIPWIIGAAFTLAVELGGLDVLIGSIVCGAIVGVFVLCVQSIHLYLARSHSAVTDFNANGSLSSSQKFRQLIADDDEIIFYSCFSFITFNFVIPPKRFRPNIVIHSLLSGLLCGFGVFYTLPSTITTLYSSNIGVAIVIFIFSWITICITQYPLTAGGVPPEVAVFRSVDPYEIASLSRFLHVCIFFAFCVVQIYHPSFETTNQVLHILFLFLPLLWMYGLLPPADALILWAVEQLQVFALGGTPVATDLRLLVSFFMSGMVLLGASFLPSEPAIVIYCAAFGFILSTDVTSVVLAIFYMAVSKCKASLNSKKTEPTHYNGEISLISTAWHIVAFGPSVIVATVVVYFRTNFTSTTQLGFQISFIVLFIIIKILQDSQKVYFAFRIFRNCIYPSSYSSMAKFLKRKKVLRILGLIHFSLAKVLNPLLMTAYLSAYLLTSIQLPSFYTALVSIHAYRVIWQRSNSAILIFAVVAIVDLITSSYNSVPFIFTSSQLGTRLLIADVCIDRFLRFCENLWFAFSLSVSSVKDKKQKRNSSIGIIILNIIFFPFVIGTIGLASALSAPLLPLFTLPIFLIGFPRHSRFWPQAPGKANASVCSDSVYYSQVTPYLTKSMAVASYLGSISSVGSETDLPFFLARSQDKSMWIQTLESGYSYISYSVKGLELQETSCHALEATRLDDACQAAFEPGTEHKWTNPYPFLSSVTPIDTIYLESYSDAKNSLTGIVDNPSALRQYHKDFIKSLVWLLVQHWAHENQTTSNQNHPVAKNPYKPDVAKPDSPNAFELISNPAKPNATPHQSKLSPNNVTPRPNSNRSVIIKGRQNLSSSATSLGSLLSSEDRFKLDQKRKSSRGTSQLKPPGVIDDSSDEEGWESGLSDSGFGLPSMQPSHGNKANNGNQQLDLSHSITKWREIPIDENDAISYLHLFDRSWYLHVTSSLEDDGGCWGASGMEEDQMMEICRSVALGCYIIVNVSGIPGKNPSHINASHLCKVFLDNIPWSPHLDWLHKNPKLHQLVLKAHRFSIKLLYDRVAMGTTDLADDEDFAEVLTSLQEYQSDWFIGLETSTEWKTAVEKGISSLFALSHDGSLNGVFSARLLTRRPVETHLNQLSSAAVRSAWANLSLELLYATNDDEERYSIQAHQALLRNLTTQSADPPLGYPIYSSKPVYTSTLPVP
ncbi:pecanex-like protein 4 [Ciona intestinalis]